MTDSGPGALTSISRRTGRPPGAITRTGFVVLMPPKQSGIHVAGFLAPDVIRTLIHVVAGFSYIFIVSDSLDHESTTRHEGN